MGRKKLEDRTMLKQTLQVHVEQFKIDKLGGNASAKKFVINAINNETKDQ